MFCDLHMHSTYSTLDGFGTPEQIMERLKVLGRKTMAITDHGVVTGHVAFQKATRKAGVKAIYGCEMYVVDDMTARTRENKSLGADGAPHVTVLAMTQKGYQNLLQLNTLSWHDGFFYKPRVDWETIAKYQEGLCVLSGCVGGYPSRLILGKGPEAAYDFIRERRQQIENYYIEWVPEPGLDISHATTPILVQIARELNIPAVMTSDAHFPSPEDHIAQDTLLCVGMQTTINDPQRTIKLPSYQYLCTEQELLQRMADVMMGCQYTREELQEAIDNAGTLADMCNVEIPKAAPIRYNCGGLDSADVLWRWIEEGLQFRVTQGKLPPDQLQVYHDRAVIEFNLFKAKKFCDYLLCVADICRYAKSLNTLVMCRGSGGGCLLLWLLQASETDSILLDLDFNRFMDVTRHDPPDVDMDFEVSMKQPIYDYISKTYGTENVCQILALSLMCARNTAHDIASVHGIPKSEYAPLATLLNSKDDDINKQLAKITDPVALKVLEKYPVFRLIDRLVGQVRQGTIHAAGVLVSSQPLHTQIAIMEQPGKPRVSSVEKGDAASLDFLKLDILMVSAFSVLADAVRKIGANMAWLYALPYDDPGVYALAQSGKVAGIFQLDGAAIKVSERTHLDVFNEIVAASALCRPGAADQVSTYVQHKFDTSAFNKYMDSIHPIAREIVRPTYGILIYQEQIMALCHKMGNMPMDLVHKMRKRIANASDIGYPLGPEYGDPFFAGCAANGVPQQETQYWWDTLRIAGIYSFNKSHAATYAIVGYWQLYIKAHYPEAYFTSYLYHEGLSSSCDQLLMKRLIKEYRETGGEIRMIDPCLSQDQFSSPHPGLIVGGWSNIDGIGKAMAALIVKNGPYTGWEDIRLKKIIPDSMFYCLHESGITGRMPHDQIGHISLAPWMPIYTTSPEIEVTRKQINAMRPGDVPLGESISGDIMITGYITTIYRRGRTGVFRGNIVIYTIEDESGCISWRVSSKNTVLAAKVASSVKRGDYICITGWWAGDYVYIKDLAIIYRRA